MTRPNTVCWIARIVSLSLISSYFAACSSSEGSTRTGVADRPEPSTPPPGVGGPTGTTPEPGDGTEGASSEPPSGDGAAPPTDGPATSSDEAGARPTELIGDGSAPGGAGQGSGPEVPANGAEGAPGQSPGCPATATLVAGDADVTIDVGGVAREFIVHAPPGYDGTRAVPVVFDFHGLGFSGSGQRNFTGWADLADEEGFIAIFPEGLPRDDGSQAWNGGGCCTDEQSDMSFVFSMIDWLQVEACIDSRRIYATGGSNGAAMTYRLACEAADVFAAVAPVDFDCVVGGACSDCSPARPITSVQFRGTDDNAVPYGTPTTGAQRNFSVWGEINSCSGDAAQRAGSPDGCEAFPSCSDGVETVLCTVEGGQHYQEYRAFDIARVAWDILQNYTL